MHRNVRYAHRIIFLGKPRCKNELKKKPMPTRNSASQKAPYSHGLSWGSSQSPVET